MHPIFLNFIVCYWGKANQNLVYRIGRRIKVRLTKLRFNHIEKMALLW